MQLLWTVGFFTAGLIALPWYGYTQIWKVPYAPDPDLDPRREEESRHLPGRGRSVPSSAR